MQTASPGIRHSEKGPHGSWDWVPGCTSELCAPDWGYRDFSHQPLKSLLKLFIKTLTEPCSKSGAAIRCSEFETPKESKLGKVEPESALGESMRMARPDPKKVSGSSKTLWMG